MYCGIGHAAFCSEDETAGKCFDEKIKPMAIAAAAVAFILGISTILLAVALLCKAQRRNKAKVMVYRQPYNNDSVRGTRQNNGFESASQYHVKRPAGRFEEQPTYLTRNAGSSDRIPVGVLTEDEKRSNSIASSGMMWVPANGGK